MNEVIHMFPNFFLYSLYVQECTSTFTRFMCIIFSLVKADFLGAELNITSFLVLDLYSELFSTSLFSDNQYLKFSFKVHMVLLCI